MRDLQVTIEKAFTRSETLSDGSSDEHRRETGRNSPRVKSVETSVQPTALSEGHQDADIVGLLERLQESFQASSESITHGQLGPQGNSTAVRQEQAFSPAPQSPGQKPGETENESGEEHEEENGTAGLKPSAMPGKVVKWRSKIIKSLVGLLLIFAAGWLPAQRMFQVSSVEAVVNARLITLRAPISGVVHSQNPQAIVGSSLAPDALLLYVENPRVDRQRYDRLRRQQRQANSEILALTHRLDFVREQRRQIAGQVENFTRGRVRQLQGEMAGLKAQLASAEARTEQARMELRRLAILNAKGIATDVDTQLARTNRDVAAQELKVIEARMSVIEVELNGAKAGTFVGESYNDRPHSAQRRDELDHQINVLETDLAKWQAVETSLTQDVAEARTELDRNRRAIVRMPTHGKVWEVLTTPGEHVVAGQDLVRLLDCQAGIVSTTVSESVFNKLRLGTPAKFRFREGGDELAGQVVQLSGLGTAPANLEVQPSNLIKESYRVLVSIPQLGSPTKCHVGRTGRVIFDKNAAS